MKVCLFTTSYPRFPGDGAGIFIAELADSVARRGHDVTVIAPAVDGQERDEPTAVHVHRFSYWFKGAPGSVGYGSGILENVRHPLAILQLPSFWLAANIALLRQAKSADIIHIHWWPNLALVYWSVLWLRKPVVVTAHGSDIHRLLKKNYFRMIAKYVLRRAQHVIVVAESMRAPLVALGVPAEKISVIPNGIPDEAQLLAIPIEKKFAGRSVTIGRLIASKNHILLLRAFVPIAKEFPESSLVVVGDGPLRGYLASQVNELGLSGQVQFLGQLQRAEIHNQLAMADIFVFGSQSEGLPIVILEAMAAAKPIVATAIPGVSQLLRSEESGLLVDPDNVAGLTLVWRRCYLEADLRQRLGAAARQAATEKYRWSAIADQTEKIYQHAAAHA